MSKTGTKTSIDNDFEKISESYSDQKKSSSKSNVKTSIDYEFEGRIFPDSFDSSGAVSFLIVDAAPHVMNRIRGLFPQSSNLSDVLQRGLYTHKPIRMRNTLVNCKEIAWLSHRYNLDFQDGSLEIVEKKTEEYDQIQINRKNNEDDDVFVKNDTFWELNPEITPDPWQVIFENHLNAISKKVLLADVMGLGKTLSSVLHLRNPGNRPAIFVCKSTLMYQHATELKRYFPQANIKTLFGRKAYDITADTDIVIVSYGLLQYWQDKLIEKDFRWKTIIFDEVSELRRLDTEKRKASKAIAEKCVFVIGADGTPIWNYGEEIWSIYDVLLPGELGSLEDFKYEWCDSSGSIVEKTLLHNHLKKLGIFIRRTKKDVGISEDEIFRTVYNLEASECTESRDALKKLSQSLLGAQVGTSDYDEAVHQFDFKMRLETGKAKAKQVAEFVRQVVAEEGKVILAGWHHDVYKVWKEELKDLNPVFLNGKATINEKEEVKKAFIEGDSQILIISLRSGAGLNGFQFVCNNIIFGELDWTPAAMDQLIFRLARRGQTKAVNAYYMALNIMADPFILERNNLKRSEHYGIIEGKDVDAEFMDTGREPDTLIKLRAMAKAYLESIGEEIPEEVDQSGSLGDVAQVLRRIRLVTTNENSMQEAIFPILKEHLGEFKIEREVKISKKSRLDFLLEKNGSKVVIECKITTNKRSDAYEQVRRYVKELGTIDGVILFVPWSSTYNFTVDGVPVITISYSNSSI